MSLRTSNAPRRRRLAVATICLAAVLVGCTDKNAPTWSLPSPFLPRTSPANLLHNLQSAYEKRNVAEYDSLLAEDFTFLPAAEERRWWPGLPETWGHDTEVLIHVRMFDEGTVSHLTLRFTAGAVEWDAVEQMPSDSIHGVSLFLYGSSPSHPSDPSEDRLSSGRGKFWFRRNGWFWPGTRDSVWTIVRWQDYPEFVLPKGGPAADIPMSGGVIKYLFLL
jgi:hypothetical protein